MLTTHVREHTNGWASRSAPELPPLDAIARILGGDVVGRNRVLVPGPGHSRGDRSLSVWIDQCAPDGFRVHSFASDDPIACRVWSSKEPEEQSKFPEQNV
jgi:hypothetical protein